MLACPECGYTQFEVIEDGDKVKRLHCAQCIYGVSNQIIEDFPPTTTDRDCNHLYLSASGVQLRREMGDFSTKKQLDDFLRSEVNKLSKETEET